jgi:hypothetical protein
VNSDKSQELLPLKDYTITIERKKVLDSASENVKSSSASEVLNMRFAELPPEELRFKDDGSME